MPVVKTTFAGERVGIFALDPGRTTGVALCTPLLKGSSEEVFKRDPIEPFEVNCNDQTVHPTRAEVAGAEELAREFLEADAEWNLMSIPSTRRFLVYEDFVLNRQPGSYDREGISPARVMSLLMGMLVKHPVNWVPQQASQAKQRWSQDRMRRAGIWTPGMNHGNDAVRHAALWVVNQMR